MIDKKMKNAIDAPTHARAEELASFPPFTNIAAAILVFTF